MYPGRRAVVWEFRYHLDRVIVSLMSMAVRRVLSRVDSAKKGHVLSVDWVTYEVRQADMVC